MEPASFSAIAKKFKNVRCAVPNCNTNGEDPNISYHKFPNPNLSVVVADYFGNNKEINKLQAWKAAVRLEEVSSYSRICSLHFKKNDYLSPDFEASRRKLKGNAVPSRNLPGKSKSKETLGIARHNRLQNRKKNKSQSLKFSKKKRENILKDKNIINKEMSIEMEKRQADSNLLINAHLHSESLEFNSVSERESENILVIEGSHSVNVSMSKNQTFVEEEENVGVQNLEDHEICLVNGKDNTPSFVKEITTDSQLSTATGLQSFKLLQNIVDAVKLVMGDRFEKKTFILNTYNRVFLTYVKLKQNLSYSFLALLFNCVSDRQCQRIFIEFVQILSKVLSVAIPWPEREEIRKNIPKCFIGFEDVRVVLDCTEIFTERPKNDCCQILTYSQYKGHYTVKFLTGVTPAGEISFVSDAYGGKAGDSAIFEQSKLLQLLEPGDAIMVDRGFYINEVCKKNKWKVIRPPNVSKKQPFTKSEAVNTTAIAKARVHIERSNQRIKVFQIMRATLPANLLPVAEDIFKVICATVNLSAPILKKDKFLAV